MEERMKAIGRKMSICMGITLSFCLSLVGILSSGHFTVPGFIISFIVSTIISLLIGFLVPMKKLNDKFCGNMKPGLGRKCLEALISDILYTPIMTLAMTAMAWKQATGQGAKIPYLPMFLKSLVLTFAVGYVLILIFTPLYFKLITGGNPGGPGRPEGPTSQQIPPSDRQ